jgi:hypothetical protein
MFERLVGSPLGAALQATAKRQTSGTHFPKSGTRMMSMMMVMTAPEKMAKIVTNCRGVQT